MHWLGHLTTLRKPWVALFISTMLLSCESIEIKDSEWCGDMGSQGAACFHTLTQAQETIPEPQWDDVRFGMICTSAQTFADWKKVIEQLCSEASDCDYQTSQQIESFFERASGFKTQNALAKVLGQ